MDSETYIRGFAQAGEPRKMKSAQREPTVRIVIAALCFDSLLPESLFTELLAT